MKNIFFRLNLFLWITTSSLMGYSYQQGVIALIQYNADRYFGKYDINKENLTNMMLNAVRHEANIVVFPEGSLYGYSSSYDKSKWCKDTKEAGCRDVSKVAEEIPSGVSTLYWSNLAQVNGIYILFNIPEVENGRFFNTSVVVGPNGYMGKYRKRKLYYLDKYYANAGKEDFVLQTEFGNFGLLICMDVTYKGYLESYNRNGIDGAILMMDWGYEKNPKYWAKPFIETRVNQANMSVYAADASPWDGTGHYMPNQNRLRNSLPDKSPYLDGISYHMIGNPSED